MTRQTIPADSRYDSLVSPFRSIRGFQEADRETLLREEREVLEGTSFWRLGQMRYQRGMQVLRAGDLNLIAGRTTPVQSTNGSPTFSCFFSMPSIGSFTTRDGSLCDEVGPGDIYLNQNYYATNTIGYLSSVFVALERQRLDRAMRSINDGQSLAQLDTSIIVRSAKHNSSAVGTGRMWALISFLDQLHNEGRTIPSCLGLDEQFYRLLSLTLLETAGRLDAVRQHWQTPARGCKQPLDDLVDTSAPMPTPASH